MKKFFATAVCFIMVAAVSISASAAGLDANKQKVMDAIKAKITVEGQSVSLPADLLTQAENYLKRDDVTIAADEADTIVAQVEEAIKIVKDAGATSVSDLSAAEKTALLDKIQAAADVVGLTVSVDTAKGKISILAGTELVASDEGAIKFTGADAAYLVVVVSAGVVLLAGCYVAARKAKLFSK